MFENSTILVAALPDGVQTIRNVLGPTPKITGASTLSEARLLLNDRVDLVICGLLFNESRMFDFLRICKADPLVRAIPFIYFRNSNSEIGATVSEGMKIACKALGATDFVDFYDLKQRSGDQETDSQFRKIIKRSLEQSA